MRRFLAFLLAVGFGLSLAACVSVPQRTAPPDYEKVHQDHQEAQEDLAEEEDKQKEE